MWTLVRWESRQLWKSIAGKDLAATAAKFAAAFGQGVMPRRYPTADGVCR